MIGEAKTFKSGREFAAFLGRVPRQRGTGGRVTRRGISKWGDVYLRPRLIHGARSVIPPQKEREPWLDKLLARQPFNAAGGRWRTRRHARVLALRAHDRTYQKGDVANAA